MKECLENYMQTYENNVIKCKNKYGFQNLFHNECVFLGDVGCYPKFK